MLLTIRTLSCPPPDTPQSIHAQFGAAGGRIGRSPPCTLILPDPNRHISREHAEIRFRDNSFSIKVVSKVNSVLVNDAVVSPGEAVQLNDGDQILIGEYLMRADIAAAVAAPPPAASLFAPASSPAAGSNPFDVFDSLSTSRIPPSAPEPGPDWFRSPAAAPPPAPKATGGASLDEFFNPTADASKFSDVLHAHPPTTQPEKFVPPAIAAPVDNRLDQFLGLHDPTAIDAQIGQHTGSSDIYRASPLNMPLNSTSLPVAPAARVPDVGATAFPDHDDIFKALEQDFGAMAGLAPPAPLPPAEPAAAARAPAPPLEPFQALAGFNAVPDSPAIPTLPPPTFAMPEVPDLRVKEEPSTLQVRASSPPAGPAAELPALKAIAPPPLPEPAFVGMAPVSAAGSPQETQRLMGVLSEALGLNPGDLDNAHPEQTLRLVGELLRMSTDGLFRMLEMRSQLKSELHIEDRTMIASRENNPLKHADTARDAIAYLVDLRQHGNKLFMPPNKAVEDTIWDICAHEMAVMAGTRAALLAALKMFSPEVIEGRIKKTGALENVLPALHKSRLWERFLGMYAELQHEAEDHFDRLLNQEFSKAYSEQSKKLKKKR